MNNFPNDKRKLSRKSVSLPVEIKYGSQVTLQGQLRDLSTKSAFIQLRNSIFLQVNDEVNFTIQALIDNVQECVEGLGRISRVAAGEGIAIFFVKMDEDSEHLLKKLFQS